MVLHVPCRAGHPHAPSVCMLPAGGATLLPAWEAGCPCQSIYLRFQRGAQLHCSTPAPINMRPTEWPARTDTTGALKRSPSFTQLELHFIVRCDHASKRMGAAQMCGSQVSERPSHFRAALTTGNGGVTPPFVAVTAF